MSFFKEFEIVEVDGKKKKRCPKCRELKDPRGIKVHYLGCPGEFEDNGGEDNNNNPDNA